MKKHAMQPVVFDAEGVIRFQTNPIVRVLLEAGPFDMNKLAKMSGACGWTDEDHAHFAQLIGYSVSGWGTLSYVAEEDAETADKLADELAEARKAAPK